MKDPAYMVRVWMGYYNGFQPFYAGLLQRGPYCGPGYDVTGIHQYVAAISNLYPGGGSLADIDKVYPWRAI